MTQPTILDTNAHRNVRIITTRGECYGENVHLVPVTVDEVANLVLDYPICFLKDHDTGQFGLYALLGFKPKQNLFLHNGQWNASYVPLHIRRQPFVVVNTTTQNTSLQDSQAPENNRLIALDMHSPRVQTSGKQGEALFHKDGSATDYLSNIQSLLAQLMSCIEKTDSFIATLLEHSLIESAQLNIIFASGEEQKYQGMYTINEENLRELPADILQKLTQQNYLAPCHFIRASTGHVKKLIDWKNALDKNIDNC